MTFKPVMRYDPHARLLRLFRLIWQVGVVGDGHGYSAKLTVALTPRFFHVSRSSDSWAFTLLGLRIHSIRSYGGVYV